LFKYRLIYEYAAMLQSIAVARQPVSVSSTPKYTILQWNWKNCRAMSGRDGVSKTKQ
jgi:hypothetical protein